MDLYDVEVLPTLISNVIDAVLEDVRSRVLENPDLYLPELDWSSMRADSKSRISLAAWRGGGASRFV